MISDVSNGRYGIADGLMYSFPVTCSGGEWKIVEGLACDDFSKEKMKVTETELMEEKTMVAEILKA